MKKDISKCIEIYKSQLENGDIQVAYVTLTKYVFELRTKFLKDYETGNVAFGYLDYTYFYFTNDYLKSKNLKFGLVLNHQKMQFELWLLGRTVEVQKEYWNILKNTKWNKDIDTKPKYSVLEVCLENNINFDNKEEMTVSILSKAISFSKEILTYLKDNS